MADLDPFRAAHTDALQAFPRRHVRASLADRRHEAWKEAAA
jgi:hypothetical protein